MKRRIIAALTALVMVVTMIPASAFAASTVTQHVQQLIASAAGMKLENDGCVDTKFNAVTYSDEQIAKVRAAREAYDKLSDEGKKEIEDEWKIAPDDTVSYADLLVAEALIAYQKTAVDAYVAEVDKVIEEAIEYDATKSTYSLAESLKTAKAALTPGKVDANFVNGKVEVVSDKGQTGTYANDIDLSEILMANVTTKLDKEKEALAKKFFGDNYETYNDAFKALASAMVKMTPEKVNTITSATDTEYKAVTDALEGFIDSPTNKDSVRQYARYIKNYKNYELATAKLEKLSPDKITKAKKNIEEFSDKQEIKSLSVAAKVNNLNYATVKRLYDEAVAVYNEYLAKPEFKNSAELKALKEVLYGNGTDKAGVKKNIEIYTKALEIKEFADRATHTGDLSGEEIKLLCKYEAEDIFADSSSVAFKNIGYFVDMTNETNNADLTSAKLKALVEKKDNQMGLLEDKEIAELYGPAIRDAIAAIGDIETLSYAKDKDAFMKVFKAYDLLLAVAPESFGKKIELGTGDDAITRIKAAATLKAGNAETPGTNIADYNKELAKIVKDTDFDKFIDKAKAMQAMYDTAIKAQEAVSTNLMKVVDNYLSDTYGGNSIDNLIKTAVEEKAVKDGISEYNDAYAKLTADGVYLYNEAQKAAETANAKTTDKARLDRVNEKLAAYALSYNAAVVEKVEEALAIIDSRVYNSTTGKAMTDAQKVVTKAALAEVDELLKDKNVKNLFYGEQVDSKKFAGVLTEDVYKTAVDGYDKTAGIANTYKNKAQIDRFLNAKLELKDVVVSTNAATVIEAIKNLKVEADIDANSKAFDLVKAQYDALSFADRALVTNYASLIAFAKECTPSIVKVIEDEMSKLVYVGSSLSDGQKETVKAVKNLLATYKNILVEAGAYNPDAVKNTDKFNGNIFHKKAGEATELFIRALDIANTTDEAATKEKLAPLYRDLSAAIAAKYETNGLTGYEAKIVASLIDRYNVLTKYEQDVFIKLTGTEVDKYLNLSNVVKTIQENDLKNFLAMEKTAKALILDFASVDKIENQIATGKEIRPVIVVKDANGKVIDNSKLNIEYLNNTVAGTATVVIIPASEEFVGRIETTFEIIEAEKPLEVVVPTGMEFHTDYGLLKVTVDKVDGLAYRYAYREEGTKAWTYVNTDENSVIITKDKAGKRLKKNTRYEVTVATVLNGERSDYNQSAIVYTNRGGNRSGNMFYSRVEKVASPSKGAVTITGRDVVYKTAPQKMMYKFAYRVKGAKSWTYTAWGDSNINTIKGLKSGKTYEVTVAYGYKSAVDNETYVYSKYATAKSVKVK